MAMLSFCGIDVSKDRLDVMVLPEQQCSSVRNDVVGWSELIERLRGFSIAAIGLEASGGYERGVMRALLAAGMSVRQINPFKLRQFAKASGVLAKNDRLDARMIASFVAIMPTHPAQRRSPAVEQLAEMVTVRRQLSDAKISVENASRMLENAMLQRLSRHRIARLAADIAAIDERLVEIVVSDAALAAHLDAGGRRRTGMQPDCVLARAWSTQSYEDRRARRCRALRFRQRQAQGNALYLGRSRVRS